MLYRFHFSLYSDQTHLQVLHYIPACGRKEKQPNAFKDISEKAKQVNGEIAQRWYHW